MAQRFKRGAKPVPGITRAQPRLAGEMGRYIISRADSVEQRHRLDTMHGRTRDLLS